MNIDYYQYPRCRHRRRLHLRPRMGGRVEKVEVGAEVVEVVQRMKNCHSASACKSCIGSSSSAPWTISATSIAAYPSRGAHTAPYTSFGLLELPLHQLIQCMDLITDGLRIGPSRPSSRHKAWRNDML